MMSSEGVFSGSELIMKVTCPINVAQEKMITRNTLILIMVIKF